MSKSVKINAESLNELKNQYTALTVFHYNPSDGMLSFEDENLGTTEIVLDEIVLMLDINDLRTFIKNRFYISSGYDEQISPLFDKLFVTEKDYHLIDQFTKELAERFTLYYKYKNIFDINIDSPNIKVFLQEMINGNNILNTARQYAIPNEKDAASIIVALFDKNKTILDNPEDKTNDTQVEQQEEFKLTRKKTNSFVDLGFDEEAYMRESGRLDAAGFTSIIAIILVTVLFGVYLAIVTMS